MQVGVDAHHGGDRSWTRYSGVDMDRSGRDFAGAEQ